MVNVIYIHYRHHHWYHFCCHYFRFPPTAITDLARRSECWGHMHPLGLLRISWPPGSLVPGVPRHLHSHRDRESWQDHHNQGQSQSANSHVLFSQPPVPYWPLLFPHSYTQTVEELCCRRQNYLLHQMHHAVLHTVVICSGRNIYVSSDGLWPICDSL